MSASPMLQAIDLMRVNIDALNLEDLEAHAQQVLDTLGGLNEYTNSPAPKVRTPSATPCTWPASCGCIWRGFVS